MFFCVLFGRFVLPMHHKEQTQAQNQAQNETNAQSTLATVFTVCFFFFWKSEEKSCKVCVPLSLSVS